MSGPKGELPGSPPRRVQDTLADDPRWRTDRRRWALMVDVFFLLIAYAGGVLLGYIWGQWSTERRVARTDGTADER